jgi:hypothetical protein
MSIFIQSVYGEQMMDKKSRILDRDWVYIALMAVIVIGFCNRLLFTDMIIRASDVITQFFWGAQSMKAQPLWEHLSSLPGLFSAAWDPLPDGGRTLEGGWNALGLLAHRFLILHFFPFPSSIAWLAVLSLLWGGIGTFCYCRTIGVSRFGSLAAGLLYALCTENASLINAGHIQKIEAISWAPWAMYFLEKGIRSSRFFHYAMTSLMLAVQFFTMHWQISFYTCLAVAAYWFFQVGARFVDEKQTYLIPFRKDFLLAVTLLVLFFSTIAMSFAPVFSWSKQSERGGGMSQEEGMSWSMPPEELLSFAIPGLVGFSRQEAGDKPDSGQAYYWGRMHFTQTNDYLGLLPWFLIPLAIAFRRDRLTWYFCFLMGATLLMALGKYTVVYQFMFDHLPGFSTFRVPKMILFLFAFAAAVLTGRGIDVLINDQGERRRFHWWLTGAMAFVAMLGLFRLCAGFADRQVVELFSEFIAAPTRYQEGRRLIADRYLNLVRETGIACMIAAMYLAVFVAWYRHWLSGKVVYFILILLFVGDLWRVDSYFFKLTPPPQSNKRAAKNDVVSFLESRIGTYRMQPLGGESAHYYADYGLANISAYVTVSEKRYREFMEIFSLAGRMPDMMNLKYLVMPMTEYQQQQAGLAGKYAPVFNSASGTVVLENKTVLPKAWLVPSAAVITDARERLSILNNPRFDPAEIALVESNPPLPLAALGAAGLPGRAQIITYEPNHIKISVSPEGNALLVLGEKFYPWWYATVDGKKTPIVPVNHILRGVYLQPGAKTVEFVFDPLPFKIGKYLTLGSLTLFAALFLRELFLWRRRVSSEG